MPATPATDREFKLTELLDDPLVRLVMRRDRVDAEALRRELADVSDRLAERTASQSPGAAPTRPPGPS